MKPPKGKLFRPVSHPGGWITLALAMASLIAGVWPAMQISNQPVSGRLFWLMLGAVTFIGSSVYLLYRAFALFRLTYLLNRNGLEIRWGAIIERVPIQNISTVLPLENAAQPKRGALGLSIPVWWAGRWGATRFFTTAAAPNALAVQTIDGAFVISPNSVQSFLQAWELRVPLGPSQKWRQGAVRHQLIAHPLWQDKLALRLGAGAILLSLILLGATMTAYPTWPAAIPIQLAAQNQTTFIANPEQLLIIPASGLIILALNLILGLLWYKKNPLITYILWSIAIVTQIGLWAAIRMIVG